MKSYTECFSFYSKAYRELFPSSVTRTNANLKAAEEFLKVNIDDKYTIKNISLTVNYLEISF